MGPQGEPLISSTFDGLTLTHPQSWVQHEQFPDDALDPAAEGYLTNAPNTAACNAHTPPAAIQACGIAVATMTPGGIYISINVLYQPVNDQLPGTANETIAGYPAQLVKGDPATLGCPPATASATSVTIAPPNLEPTQVWVVACFGAAASRLAQQFAAMIATAKLVTRPPATTAVPGSRPCTSEELSVGLAPLIGGVSQTEAVSYAIRNISAKVCTMVGSPGVELGAGRKPIAAIYRYGGGPYGVKENHQSSPIYLQPGAYATFVIAHNRCQSGPGTRATTARITIAVPGGTKTATLPVTDRYGRSGISICADTSKTIYIGPFTAY